VGRRRDREPGGFQGVGKEVASDSPPACQEGANEKVNPFVILAVLCPEQFLGHRVPLVGAPDEQMGMPDPAGECLQKRHSSSFVVGIVGLEKCWFVRVMAAHQGPDARLFPAVGDQRIAHRTGPGSKVLFPAAARQSPGRLRAAASQNDPGCCRPPSPGLRVYRQPV
jgi:hypothetical protein